MKGRGFVSFVSVLALGVAALVSWRPAAGQTYGTITGKLSCPGSAVPGQSIKVSGEGFAASGLVTFHWDGSPDILATATANLLGFVSGVVTVPPLTGNGNHELWGKGQGRDGGTLILKCKIKITVALSLQGAAISATHEKPGAARWPVAAAALVPLVALLSVPVLRARHRRRRPPA